MNSTTEDFSALPRTDKIKAFRKKAQEMQTRRNGRQTSQVLSVARKMGKEEQVKMRVQFAMVQNIDDEQCRLWERVLEDNKIVGKKGETIMAIMRDV